MSFIVDMLALLVMGACKGRENGSKPEASLLALAEVSHLRGRMAQRLASVLLWDVGDQDAAPCTAADHGGSLSQRLSCISFGVYGSRSLFRPPAISVLCVYFHIMAMRDPAQAIPRHQLLDAAESPCGIHSGGLTQAGLHQDKRLGLEFCAFPPAYLKPSR